MILDSIDHSPPVTPSAVKWGLIHVAGSVTLGLVSTLIFKLVQGQGEMSTLSLAISSVVLPIIGFIMSAVLMFLGMNQLKKQASPPSFKFMTALKWSAIFIALFAVVYGVFQIGLSAYVMSTMDMSEIPEEATEYMTSPLAVILPTFFSVAFSSIVLAGMGLVIGLILKTD